MSKDLEILKELLPIFKKYDLSFNSYEEIELRTGLHTIAGLEIGLVNTGDIRQLIETIEVERV